MTGMLIIFTRLALVSALFISGSARVSAEVIGFRSVLDLVADADVIVVGWIATVDDGGDAGRVDVVITSPDVLKGALPVGPARLSVPADDISDRGKELNGRYVLAFLLSTMPKARKASNCCQPVKEVSLHWKIASSSRLAHRQLRS